MIDLELAVRLLSVLVMVIGTGIVLLVVGSLAGSLLRRTRLAQTREADEHEHHWRDR